MRPALLPDNPRWFCYPLVMAALAIGVGIWLGNLVVILLPCIVVAVFPGMPIFFHAIFFLFVRLKISDKKLVLTDFVSSPHVPTRGKQEMLFADIDYIYYLDRESELLVKIRKKLKKYSIAKNEQDYRKTHLMNKYHIPDSAFAEIEEEMKNPLLLTRLKVERYRKATEYRGGLGALRTTLGLVLSNHDGNRKMYFMYFSDLNRKDRLRLINIIRNKKSDICFLMDQNEQRALQI